MGIIESTRRVLLVSAAAMIGGATAIGGAQALSGALPGAEPSGGPSPPVASATTTRTAPAQAAAIKQARLQQNAAIASHDLDAIASYWTDDVTICRGLGLQLAGKAAYRKLFEGDDPVSKDVIVYERIPTSIEVSPNWPLAFETGSWEGHLGNVHGPAVIHGRYSAQWVQRADKWLIRSEVFVALTGSGSGLQMKAAP